MMAQAVGHLSACGSGRMEVMCYLHPASGPGALVLAGGQALLWRLCFGSPTGPSCKGQGWTKGWTDVGIRGSLPLDADTVKSRDTEGPVSSHDAMPPVCLQGLLQA